MCLPSTFWRTDRRTVVIPMTSQFGCLELLITRTFLSGPAKFEITRVDCIFILSLEIHCYAKVLCDIFVNCMFIINFVRMLLLYMYVDVIK